MKPRYKNWMPKNLLFFVTLLSMTSIGLTLGFAIAPLNLNIRISLGVIFGVTSVLSLYITIKLYILFFYFSYEGKKQLSKKIIDSLADYIKLESNQSCLDVGCGSGALSIAVAKNNPQAKVVGIDMWGKTYEFSKSLCEYNAKAENVSNVTFSLGDARKLNFEDESFDAITSNYVYHNIPGKNHQDILLENLRVLKKGGTFAIHDLMIKSRYGDLESLVKSLKNTGVSEISLISTTNGLFMSKKVARITLLKNSFLLVGKK